MTSFSFDAIGDFNSNQHWCVKCWKSQSKSIRHVFVLLKQRGTSRPKGKICLSGIKKDKWATSAYFIWCFLWTCCWRAWKSSSWMATAWHHLARLEPDRRSEEQYDTVVCCQAREDPTTIQEEQCRDTARREQARADSAVRSEEQERDTPVHQLTWQDPTTRREEQERPRRISMLCIHNVNTLH